MNYRRNQALNPAYTFILVWGTNESLIINYLIRVVVVIDNQFIATNAIPKQFHTRLTSNAVTYTFYLMLHHLKNQIHLRWFYMT